VDVPGDGNCSLHAIVHEMLTQDIALDAKALRQQAVSFLRHTHICLMRVSWYSVIIKTLICTLIASHRMVNGSMK